MRIQNMEDKITAMVNSKAIPDHEFPAGFGSIEQSSIGVSH
jgi:hypothetical protein